MKPAPKKTNKKYNLDAIRRQCDLKYLISTYGIELEEKGDRWWARCPFHDDGEPSFTVRRCEDGAWRCGCFACGSPGNGEGDCFDFVMLREGCTIIEAAEKIIDICGIDAGETYVSVSGTFMAEPMIEPVAEPAKPEPKEPKSKEQNNNPKRKTKIGATLATYDYRRDGELIFQVLRKAVHWEDTGEVIKGKKSFLIRQPNGNGGWVYSEKGIPPGAKPLYWQDEFVGHRKSQPIWIVEGEKDVETLRAEGLLATTNAHGARAAWEPQYTEALRGRDVIICGDSDAPGRERDATIAMRLHGAAASIRMIQLPEGLCKDVTEWKESGQSVTSLLEMATVFVPPGFVPPGFVSPGSAPRDEPRDEQSGRPHPGNPDAEKQQAHASRDDDRGRKQYARVTAEDRDWRSKLICKPGTSIPKALFANAVTVLRHAPEFAGKIKFNSFTGRPVSRGELPWGGGQEDRDWSDYYDSCAAEWIQHQGIDVMPAVVSKAVALVARESEFHPVRDYLNFLKWDYTPRLPGMFENYFGSVPSTPENKAYFAAAAERWMMCAVARIFEPGCKADYCIVLNGGEGKGKSQSLKALGEPWFTEDLSRAGSEQAAYQCEGVWIIEIGELCGLAKSSDEDIKRFISQSSDRFRRVWERYPGDVPRQCVFAGTTNKPEWLKSAEGNRRFWPIPTGEVMVDKVKEDRDQLWAEAVWRYRTGAPRFLDSPELEAEARSMQDERRIGDVWEDRIVTFAKKPKEISAFRESYPMISTSNCVTLDDILIHCIGKTPDRWQEGASSDKLRVQRCLTANGFVKRRLGKRDARRWCYVKGDAAEKAAAEADEPVTDQPI